jgi:RNA ligase
VTTATSTLNLRDLFGLGELELMLQDGYVREQQHPTEGLTIFNYTEKAAYENVWNPVTLACRGLIARPATGEVVARPFTKFFNYGQVGAATIALDAPVQVTDKMDGSLGIVYPTSDGRYAVATRGSFASDQAVHATALLRSRYATWWPTPGWTALFEIVYPANRIVCDYGDTDDLVFLGAVDMLTGKVEGPGVGRFMGWRGPATTAFAAPTLSDALAIEPRPNAEGVVVRCLNTGGMIKLKQADYVALHRIVTGLSARTVWQHLVDGKSLDELIAPLPDEFHPWVQDIANGITTAVQQEAWRLEEEYTRVRDAMPDAWQAGDRASRAEFAKVAAKLPDSWALFALLDGKDIRPKLLVNAKPEPYLTPSGRTYTEDNA